MSFIFNYITRTSVSAEASASVASVVDELAKAETSAEYEAGIFKFEASQGRNSIDI